MQVLLSLDVTFLSMGLYTAGGAMTYLRDSGLDKRNVHDVVLVGGITEFFHETEPNRSVIETVVGRSFERVRSRCIPFLGQWHCDLRKLAVNFHSALFLMTGFAPLTSRDSQQYRASTAQARTRHTSLSASMVTLGDPGDARALVLVGFVHGPVVFRRLTIGDRVDGVTSKQACSTASVLVYSAWYLTAVSWLTYPFVYIIKIAKDTVSALDVVGYGVVPHLITSSRDMWREQCSISSLGQPIATCKLMVCQFKIGPTS